MIKVDKERCEIEGKGDVILSEISVAICDFVDSVAKKAEEAKQPLKKDEIFANVMASIVSATTFAFKSVNDEK